MAAKLSGPTSGKKYTIEANADINVTPFVDIMLVLLIIFMVSIPPSTAFYKIDMPPTPKDFHPIDNRKPVIISLNNNGNIYLTGAQDRQTTMENLVGDVSGALTATYPEKGDPRNNAIFLRADPDVPYERFMNVLNALEDAGYSKLGLVNEDIT